MELMPAWKRWGYEEGLEKGMEQGLEQGVEAVARNLISLGIEDGTIIKATRLSPEKILSLRKLLEEDASGQN
ncbi:hypothetical protein [Paenibacillus sp. YN15]|uniref:hypothetical protein n=1 Tax=Paenibacillus sp. YN15 TaxID=1742774 RepID=UPI000DCE6FA0|nr:hypothetical protein [Paenibacillus sp. YN15]RAV01487.1 hypothetical protein DQG13_12345 [Paenibacillus sp. YN15]